VEEQDVLAQLAARDLEQEPVANLVNVEHPVLGLGLTGDDTIVGERVRRSGLRHAGAAASTATCSATAAAARGGLGRICRSVGRRRRLTRPGSGRCRTRSRRRSLGCAAADRQYGGGRGAQDESGTRSHIHPAYERNGGGRQSSTRWGDNPYRIERSGRSNRWSGRPETGVAPSHSVWIASIGASRAARSAG